MNCPRCNHLNRPDAKFCQRCGERLSPAHVGQSACVKCYRPLRPGVRFCPHCGARQPVDDASGYRPPPPPVSWFPPTPPLLATPPPQPSPPLQPDSGPRSGAPRRSGKHTRGYVLRHSMLIVGLTLGLAAALTAALLADSNSGSAMPPPVATPPTALAPMPQPTADYREAVVQIGYADNGRFGLMTLGGDPAIRSDDNKLLTFDLAGATSNTRIWIDGDTPIYGGSTFLGFGLADLMDSPHEANGRISSAWEQAGIRVEQVLSYARGSTTERVDTVQVKYILSNQGSTHQKVGLRVMLDTLIGDNDGVPFLAPGQEGIISRAIDLRGSAIPDFIQALERPNLVDPGVIVNLTLRGADATPPDRLTISAWCDENAGWDDYHSLGGDGHPLERCSMAGEPPDSAVTLYFDPAPLAPGEQRTFITYYGLGGISSTASGNASLSLTFDRSVTQGEQFWVIALIMQPQEGQRVQLTLPAGLVLAPGSAVDQSVPVGGDFAQISWLVQAQAPLQDGPVTVTLMPDGLAETQSISVFPTSIVH